MKSYALGVSRASQCRGKWRRRRVNGLNAEARTPEFEVNRSKSVLWGRESMGVDEGDDVDGL